LHTACIPLSGICVVLSFVLLPWNCSYCLLSSPLVFSSQRQELLNLRKIEETLAKAKEYTEAQKVKMKGDAMVSSRNCSFEEIWPCTGR
jgi:hypothetical protein